MKMISEANNTAVEVMVEKGFRNAPIILEKLEKLLPRLRLRCQADTSGDADPSKLGRPQNCRCWRIYQLEKRASL